MSHFMETTVLLLPTVVMCPVCHHQLTIQSAGGTWEKATLTFLHMADPLKRYEQANPGRTCPNVGKKFTLELPQIKAELED